MTKLVIPGRYLLEVEYPQVVPSTMPGIKKLSPLKLTTWAPHKEGQYVHPDVLEYSNKIQEDAVRLLMGGETFELTLAPGTLNEVRYPKVILTTLRPIAATRMGEGPGCEMEFLILAVPQTRMRTEMSFPINYKESDVKIYEAVIVKLDDKGEPESVVKVVPPFVAKNDRAAQDAVMVDYAQENHLAGKDLAGYSVRVRTFQATV